MLVLYLTFLDDEHDKSLFEKIYISHRKQMALLAMSLLKDESDAEDVVADVFLRIAQRNFDVIRAIKNDTNLRNYLLKATKQQLVRGKKMLLGLLRTKGDEKNGNGLC